MGSAVYPSSVVLSAYLSSAWVDISDYQFGRMSVKYGISKNGPIDFLADTGVFSFSLRSPGGRFLPLVGIYTDWKKGCKVKLEISFDGSTRTFYGAVDTITPNIDVEKETETVKVTAVDWLDRAAKYPLSYPDIILEKTADQIVQTILTAMPIQPLEQSLAVGATTFPVVFDTVTDFTKARTEFSKVLLSELCYMYVKHSGALGEKLVLENRNTRLTAAVKTIPTYSVDAGFLLMETGELLLLETGDDIILDLSSSAAFTDEEVVKYQISYGDNIINDIRFRYIPKRYSTTDPQYVYAADMSRDLTIAGNYVMNLSVEAGETKTISSKYEILNNDVGDVGDLTISLFKNAGSNAVRKIRKPYPTTLTANSYAFNNASLDAASALDNTPTYTLVCLQDRFILTLINDNAWKAYYDIYIQMATGSALIVSEPEKLSTVFQDVTSIATNDYQPLQWDMPYQITSTVGDTFAAAVLAAEKDPRAVLNKITFSANYHTYYMLRFMFLDIGDYFFCDSLTSIVNNYYFLQSFAFDIDPGGIINVAIGVKEA